MLNISSNIKKKAEKGREIASDEHTFLTTLSRSQKLPRKY